MSTSNSRPYLQLLEPNLEMLPAYADALGRGWSPDNVEDVSASQLAEIGRDPAAFIAELCARVAPSSCPTARSCRGYRIA
jgi:hypothetical protein